MKVVDGAPCLHPHAEAVPSLPRSLVNKLLQGLMSRTPATRCSPRCVQLVPFAAEGEQTALGLEDTSSPKGFSA